MPDQRSQFVMQPVDDSAFALLELAFPGSPVERHGVEDRFTPDRLNRGGNWRRDETTAAERDVIVAGGRTSGGAGAISPRSSSSVSSSPT